MSRKRIKTGKQEKPLGENMVHSKSIVDDAVMEEITETQINAENLESLETELDRVRKEVEQAKLDLAEKQNQLKSVPMREIDEEEMILVKKQKDKSQASKGLEEKISKQKVYDNVMVTGKFINRRAPGNSVKLTYMKYQDDPVKWYTLEDGKVYTLPRGFVDQINEHYYKPNFIQKTVDMDPNRPSGAISEVDTSSKIYNFVPVNF